MLYIEKLEIVKHKTIRAIHLLLFSLFTKRIKLLWVMLFEKILKMQHSYIYILVRHNSSEILIIEKYNLKFI